MRPGMLIRNQPVRHFTMEKKMEEELPPLALNVRKLRTKAKFTQEQLAEKTGLGINTIQRLEVGGASSLETVQTLAIFFNTKIDKLIVTQ